MHEVTGNEITLDTHDGRGKTRAADVRYYAAGEGDPVVLLHGIGLDAAPVSFKYLLPELARTHRVYALDFPGHGASGKPRVRYTTGYFQRTLEAFLRELDIKNPSLLGISMGGAVALGHALDHDVDKLVCVASYGLGSDAHWRPAASVLLRVPFAHRNWWAGVGASPDTVRGHLRNLTGERPPADLVEDVYANVQDAAVGRTVRSWQRSEFRFSGLETDYRPRLPELEAETLFLHGEADPLVPSAWSLEAAAAVPTGGAEVFADCGHWLPREAPERFNSAVTEFLAPS
jgi:pimeloyl-ACP methyl ester carboxylesterase